MFIHSISPVSNIPRQSILTYFSKDEISKGTLVEVLYGRNKILGIVLDSSPLKNMKEMVRTQDFQLKKINCIIEKEKIDSETVEKIQKWSTENFALAGKILTDIFPKWFWEEKFLQITKNTIHSKSKTKETYIETNFSLRMEKYQNEIQKHNIVWFCVPSILALKKIQALLKKDETYTNYEILSFHGGVAEQKQITQYKNIGDHNKVVILSTPYYFGLFNRIADLLIYENTGDDGYTLGQKYSYDALMLFDEIKNKHSEYIYGGDLLPVLKDWIPDQVRNDNTKKLTNTNKSKLSFTGYTKENTRYNELFVSPHIEKQFLDDVSKGKKILLLTQYKDNNIRVVCNDCKTTVTCPKCNLALRSVIKKGISYFHCNFCKKSYKSNVKCTTCQSWNLTALGINTKTIKEFVEKKYKEASPFVTIASFSESEKYIEKEFDGVYIISIDGLMHNPHFTTEEKIVRTLLKIQELGTNLYVQTSFPFPNILSEIKNTSLSKWKTGELKKRKQAHYPPFGTLHTITAGTIRDKKLLEALQKKCDEKNIPYIESIYRMTIYGVPNQIKEIGLLLNEYRESSLVIKVDR